MEVILKQDFSGLGHKNDLVKVKPGYGRNYLIPQGLAMPANAINRKIAQENARQAAHKVAQRKQEAEALAAKLDQLTIEVAVKAGDSGKIFGSVTALQVAEALKAQGITINRKDIRFSTPVKVLGAHEVSVTLHKDVVHTLKFKVIATQ